MNKPKKRLGFKPAVAVPGALLLVTVLAGVVGVPQYLPGRMVPLAETNATAAAQAISEAISHPAWAGVPSFDQNVLAALEAPEGVAAEIVPAAAPAEVNLPEVLLPTILSARVPAGFEFTPRTLVQSANGQYTLTVEPDGNLVLLDGEEPAFAAGAVEGDVRVVFSPDGNLVQYVGDHVVRETNTADQGGIALQLTDDGNLLIVDAAGEPVWGIRDVPGSTLFMRMMNIPPAESAEVVWSEFYGPNSSERVLLTFDDCPKTVESFTETIDFAFDNNIGLLIFPTTDCVQSFEGRGFDLVDYARQRGMWVGNHSVSHPQLPKLTDAEIVHQISQAPYTNLVRPPFGAVSERVRDAAASVGSRIVLWNVDTNDWQGKSTQQVIDYVITNSHPGANVLMHMQHAGFNPGALAAMRDGLAARGLELCPVALEPTTESAPAELCM